MSRINTERFERSTMKWKELSKMSIVRTALGKSYRRPKELEPEEDFSQYCRFGDFTSYSLAFSRQPTAYYSDQKTGSTVSINFVEETLKLFRFLDNYRGKGLKNTQQRITLCVFTGNQSSPSRLLRTFMKEWRFLKLTGYEINQTTDNSLEVTIEVSKLGFFSPKRDIRIV